MAKCDRCTGIDCGCPTDILVPNAPHGNGKDTVDLVVPSRCHQAKLHCDCHQLFGKAVVLETLPQQGGGGGR